MLNHNFFVVWWGDLEKDPLDKGCDTFESLAKAINLSNIMENKGYSVKVWKGKPIKQHLAPLTFPR